MIFVYEPLCKGISHEVYNVAFLKGISLAYPDEEIRVFADQTHLDRLSVLLESNALKVGMFKFIDTKWPKVIRWSGAIRCACILYDASHEWRCYDKSRVIFLSYDTTILLLLKLINKYYGVSVDRIALVTHGIFESVASDRFGRAVPLNPRDANNCNRGHSGFVKGLEVFQTSGISALWGKGIRYMSFRFKALFDALSVRGYSFVMPTLKYVLLWRDSRLYNYVLLSPHINCFIKAITDVSALRYSVLPLPRIMPDYPPAKHGQKPIFAVIGYGVPNAMEKVLEFLDAMDIKKQYEIRLIGMMPRRLDQYKNVFMPLSSHSPLDRHEMESLIKDVNIQLILYSSEYYRLSCSGSIYEAMAYNKPILHVRNPCIDYYNNEDYPIGFAVDDLKGLSIRMAEIINSYESFEPIFSRFHYNLEFLRRKYGVDSSIDIIRDLLL